MSKPTGKLLFAYQTIANLEAERDTLRTANQRLEGEVARLRESLIEVTASLEWNAHGICRGVIPLVMDADYARLEQECERLRADKAAIDLLNKYIVTAEHPVTGKTAICADSGTLRDCMEAALSTKP